MPSGRDTCSEWVVVNMNVPTHVNRGSSKEGALPLATRYRPTMTKEREQENKRNIPNGSYDISAVVFLGSRVVRGTLLGPAEEKSGEDGTGTGWCRVCWRLKFQLFTPSPDPATIARGGGSVSGVGESTSPLSARSWILLPIKTGFCFGRKKKEKTSKRKLDL